MSATAQAQPRADARAWWGLAVLALPTLLVSIDVSILHLAIPQIAQELTPSSSQLLWIVDIYGFLLAGFLVAMGILGDRIGRRTMLFAGGAAFGVASVAAAFAPTAEMLILARACLGIAAATLMPSTLALIMTLFVDETQRRQAIGIWVTMFSGGIALGPVVGGALLTTFWWGSVFLLAVPVVLVLLIAGPRLLPEYRNQEAGRLDVPSVGLFVGSSLALVYAVKGLALDGAPTLALAALVTGLVCGAAFVRRQSRLPEPVLDLALLRSRTVAGCLVVMLTAMFIAGGTYLFVTQYLQLVEGLDPFTAGLWLLPSAALLTVTAMAAPALVARFQPGHVVAGGLAISLVGHVLLWTADASSGFPLVIVGFTLAYGGGGPLVALGTDLVMGASPPERAGAASAMSETSTELGMALGVGLLGSLGTAVYRAGLPPADAAPSGLAGPADQSLAVLLSTAEGRDGVDAYLAAAMQSFTEGLNTTGMVSALATVILIAVCLLGLRPQAGADASTDTPEIAIPVDRESEAADSERR